SLPPRRYMDAAKARWEAAGLPALDMRTPWYGYPFTGWTQENEEEARLAESGRYLETGEKLRGRQVPSVPNDQI
ncbi:MAG TPA: hypothetical protein VN603_04665, partial [Candidatus Acidoferrales bacterium]|nr:hypothetical protein [Candidatus Acidoferrales bacterium]